MMSSVICPLPRGAELGHAQPGRFRQRPQLQQRCTLAGYFGNSFDEVVQEEFFNFIAGEPTARATDADRYGGLPRGCLQPDAGIETSVRGKRGSWRSEWNSRGPQTHSNCRYDFIPRGVKSSFTLQTLSSTQPRQAMQPDNGFALERYKIIVSQPVFSKTVLRVYKHLIDYLSAAYRDSENFQNLPPPVINEDF